jgi:hypothetical protein
MLYKVPMTITISFVATLEAGSPEGALTDLKTYLDFSGDEFEDTEDLLFASDTGVEISESILTGEPSFGVVEESSETDDGFDKEEEAEDEEDNALTDEDSAPATSDEATPPKDPGTLK